MKKKRRVSFIILIAILGVIIAILGAKSYMEASISGLTISGIDMSKLEDGTYSGSCKAFPVEAEVRVTIKSHRIESIDLIKHTTGEGEGAEVITEKVVEAQTLEVDSVSGATLSSKVILKAIEDALKKAI